MFKLFFVAILLGILLALLIFFVLPFVVSEAEIVAFFASSILELSNARYAQMPQPVADLLAHLNLLIIAIAAGLLFAMLVFTLMLLVGLLKLLARTISQWLQGLKKEEVVTDLPPLELDERYKKAPKGKDIMGGNLDSIDRQ